jgi:redox-sensitive bicupin YhaK (pirin superfamily)
MASKEKAAPLRIHSDVNAYTAFLENGKELSFDIQHRWGVYLANLEGGNLDVNGKIIPERGAAKIENEKQILIKAVKHVELLLLEVSLDADYIGTI